MFLELTHNGSLLNEHFERFLPGAKYDEKRFAVLDIEWHRTSAPAPFKPELSQFESCRYTYVVQGNALYRGTDVFIHPVRPSYY